MGSEAAHPPLARPHFPTLRFRDPPAPMTRRKDPRTARLPSPIGELPAFTPVPRRSERHDGWTPDRQRSFIEALADTGSVAAACKAVDMSTVGAYQLRRQAGAEEFRAAWTAALDHGVQRIEDVAMDRALNGVEEPLYSYGALIGTRTRYNDRLLMFILRNRAPERFSDGRARSLNAVDAVKIDQLKKQWLKEHLAAEPNVTTAAVEASINRKIEEIRRNTERKQAAQWAKLSQETRAAWARFAALRERDLDAMQADEAARALIDVTPQQDWPNMQPPCPRVLPPPPEPPKTEWTLMDDSFDP